MDDKNKKVKTPQRPSTAPDRPESPTGIRRGKGIDNPSSKKKGRYGLMNDNDRKVMSKIQQSNLTIKGNSAQKNNNFMYR